MIPHQVSVYIDVPRGSFLKPRRGRWPLISPYPAPFDYGDVLGTVAADGDPQDVIVLGRRHEDSRDGVYPVVGVIRFVDGGHIDDKWVAGRQPTAEDLSTLNGFFRTYAQVKRFGNWVRRRPGQTAFLGYEALVR